MIHILVVDDEPDVEMLIRQRFRRQISAGEYVFAFAHDGQEALEMIVSKSDTDFVLSDINMPRMDGLTLLTRLKEINPTIQVVMVSAYGDMANIRTAMNRGAFDFVVKPIDFQDLQITITKTISHVLQLQSTREQLRRIDAMKDQFLANTSHELRTPLLGIIGLAEAMQERLQYPENQDDIRMIISSGRRLSYLVDDILDFSRLRNADIELQLKSIHLRSMAEVVVKTMAPLTAGKLIELRNEIPEDLSAAYADENRLMQVLFNLLGNAVKFTASGRITLSARETEGMLEISVSDTGIGIASDKQEVIFQEFSQADTAETRNYAGTGLGLPISRKLVELHGGKIWVKSMPDEGAVFSFTLPLSEEKANIQGLIGFSQELAGFKNLPELNPSPTPQVLPYKSSGLAAAHILIVDDEPINQQVLKNHLASQEFRISQALNGPEAIRMLDNDPSIDLVLLDIMMPRMSGYEVCEKIRLKHLASELPVIMVTAKNQVQDLVQGLALGANDYIAKPFSREELLARIRTQLDLQHIFEMTGRFVPNEFIRALGKNSITEVALGDQTERQVSVLFSDIRDYTPLSEGMTPEQNFGFINAFHGRLGPVIQQNLGFVNQYLGDGIMAIFPLSAEDALKSAIQMQATLLQYNGSRHAKGRKPIRIGIGLHTGSLIMGIIGDPKRFDAATISDSVNTAARIETLTKYFGANILLSENSYQQLADPSVYLLRYLGPVQVKGKAQLVKVFECCNGDAPELQHQKRATLARFEEGIQAYFDQNYTEAAEAFQSVTDLNPHDAAAGLFLQRSRHFLEHGAAAVGLESMNG